jgi:hypothetical protein
MVSHANNRQEISNANAYRDHLLLKRKKGKKTEKGSIC